MVAKTEKKDEKTSLGSIIQQFGGRMLYIIHGDGTSRNVEFNLNGEKYEFDPSRIFDGVGAEAILKEFGNFSEGALKAVRNFAEKNFTFLASWSRPCHRSA